MTNVQVKIMTKVYFFANCHSCPGEQSGGDKRFREIFKRIVDFERIIITSKFGLDIYAKDVGQAEYLLTSEEKQKKNILLSYLMRTIKSLLLNLKISDQDILYSTSDFLPDVLPAFFYKLKNKARWVQVIHHLYENPSVRKGKSFVVNLFGFLSQRLSFILIKSRADLTIVVNPSVRQQLLEMGFNGKKIFTNYNGVDFEKIQRFQPSIKKYDCVFLGRLNVSKGIFDLVEIWKNVLIKNPHAMLAIVGGGNNLLEQKLKNEIINQHLEKNIDVLGYLDDAEVFGILKSSKIFVFPSHEEGFGIAILEAMASGLPVIAWDLKSYRNIFARGIIRVPVGNTEAFSRETLRLLDDSELRSSYSKDALEIASRYGWNRIAEREMVLIESLGK
jgi:glycosyltransferase involved in cell wall biosynthesis